MAGFAEAGADRRNGSDSRQLAGGVAGEIPAGGGGVEKRRSVVSSRADHARIRSKQYGKCAARDGDQRGSRRSHVEYGRAAARRCAGDSRGREAGREIFSAVVRLVSADDEPVTPM